MKSPARQKIEIDLTKLSRMGPSELQPLFRQLFGMPVPAGSTEYARRKIARRLQELHEGGLPDSARERALAIAQGCQLRVRLQANFERRTSNLPARYTTATQLTSDHDSRIPMPGSLIVKRYKGRMITVRVLNDGFEYERQHFKSLSAVATAIAGVKWNGMAFFDLNKGAANAR